MVLPEEWTYTEIAITETDTCVRESAILADYWLELAARTMERIAATRLLLAEQRPSPPLAPQVAR
jgi:hypothetical protein